MNDFSHIDEKEFLECYANFTVEIRPFIIKKFAEQYQQETNDDKKLMLFTLAMEQFYLFYESFVGFFQAIKDRERTPVLQTLNKNLNFDNLYSNLNNKTAEDVLRELNLPIDTFELSFQKKIKEEFTNIICLFKNKDFNDRIKIQIPLFNKLKHKLLIYKNTKNDIAFLLPKEADDHFQKFLLLEKIDSTFSKFEINGFVEMAERIKCVIRDLIAVRLIENCKTP